ncbi:hypothetical protein ABT297_09400 [Dactylosporangium sp. NPDC000555]
MTLPLRVAESGLGRFPAKHERIARRFEAVALDGDASVRRANAGLREFS